MRICKILLICLLCCMFAACLSPVAEEVCTQTPVVECTRQQPPAEKNFQYYAMVYQQWIILGAYILTTIIMAFYTKKCDKKKIQKVKQAADAILISRRGRPGMLLRLFHLLFRARKK